MRTTVHIGRIGRANDPEAVIKGVMAALNALAPAQNLIKPGARVVIKPNLTADTNLWEKGIVTNPYTVEGVIRYVQQANPAEIAIAEATACGLDNKKAFRANGYEEMAVRTGAKIVDLYDEEFVSVPVENGMVAKTIKVARRILSTDFLINVPAMKTHVATGVSLSLKNLKGVLPENEKWRSHFLGVNKFVTDLNSIVKPQLCLIDGTVAMEGDSPMQGTPVNLGIVVAGTDAVATDLVAARVMGFDPWQFKCFNYAKAQGLGVFEEADIVLSGVPLEEVKRSFQPASGPIPAIPGITITDGGACPGCLDGVRIALGRIRTAKLLDKLPAVHIIVGEKGQVAGENDVVIGRCLKRCRGMKHYVPGCPAQVFVIADELRELAGEQRLFGAKEQYLLQEDVANEKQNGDSTIGR
jgi:uncharacterized protein (DUF362 family)